MAYAGIVSILEIDFNVVLNARLPNIAIKIAKDKIGKFTKNWTVCKLKLHSKILCFTEMYAKNKEILYSGHPRNFDILVRNKSQGRSTIGSHQVIDFIVSVQPRIIILKKYEIEQFQKSLNAFLPQHKP